MLVSPNSTSPERKLAFFHMGKTAGTSFARFLTDAYASAKVWQQSFPRDFSFDEPPGIEQFSAVSGHLPVAQHIGKIPNDWIKVTILRSPLLQLSSAFYHFRSRSSEAESVDAGLFDLARRRPLASFLQEGSGQEFLNQFDNPATRFILGETDERVGDEHYAAAVDTLAKLDAVGISEYLAATIHLVAGQIGVETPSEFPVLKTNPQNEFRLELADSNTLRALMERTDIDDRIYQWALRRFLMRLEDRSQLQVQPHPIGAMPPVYLADIFRVGDPQVKNAEIGSTVQINADEIMLHPPSPGVGRSELIVNDLQIFGRQHLRIQLVVPDSLGPEVNFVVILQRGGNPIFQTSCSVSGGQASTLQATLPIIHGAVELILATEVNAPFESNEYGTAIFKRGMLY